MNIPKFERFFRAAASLDVDKEDLRRYDEFVNREISDLLDRGQATAKANDRDVILPAEHAVFALERAGALAHLGVDRVDRRRTHLADIFCVP